ncbi:MAG: hypothetical protein OXU20_11510 [Myxococcales bacterium]|nr:hypothetical protein [Myxococcales bacterium]MDD9968593.1 hypothetical protein [Myxococcales bacterium]
MSSVTPRSVVLNTTRVAPERALPVLRLVEIGGLFGFTGNAMRVAIARLCGAGMLERDERGFYRVGAAAAALGAHVDEWRRGEARVRPWDGGFLAVALGSTRDRRARRASLRALVRMGMREALPGLWLRPDNLAASMEQTHERLAELGLDSGAPTFRCRDLDESLARRLRTEVWPVEALQAAHGRALEGLERSLARLASISREEALVETYLAGSEAIRVLASDPLLPDEIMPSGPRRALTERMLAYDAIGHRLWNEMACPPLGEALGGDGAG